MSAPACADGQDPAGRDPAGRDPAGAARGGAARGGHAWEQLSSWWLVILSAVALVTAAVFAIDATLAPWQRAAGVALVSALAAAFRWVGHPAAGAGDTARTAWYLAGAIAVEAALLAIHPIAFLLLFGLYPQCYASFRRFRYGVVYAAVLTFVTATASLGWAGWERDAIPVVLLQVLFSSAFGLFFGVWIHRIIGQSAERAALIEELERTRGELAAANLAVGVRTERERLAAEIHDTLAQGFTSIVLLAAAARGDGARRDEHLAAIEATARQNLAEARALVEDLAPAPLHDATLVAAVRRLADAFERETGVRARLVVHGEATAGSAAHDVTLLRATQEALANVRKHAAASSVRIELTYGPEVRLRVVDDGRGFDAAATDDGFGLAGLRRRVALQGGTATVCSAPGSGTTIEVELP